MIELDADLKSLSSFLEAVREYAADLDFDNSSIMQIELALEEVIVNIINYAYPEKKGKIKVLLSTEDGGLIINIIDSGIPFNIMDIEDPDLDASLENRQVGGLGVFFVKQFMDNVIYERSDEENILTLIKNK